VISTLLFEKKVPFNHEGDIKAQVIWKAALLLITDFIKTKMCR